MSVYLIIHTDYCTGDEDIVKAFSSKDKALNYITSLKEEYVSNNHEVDQPDEGCVLISDEPIDMSTVVRYYDRYEIFELKIDE